MCLGFLVHLFLSVEGDNIALILQKNIGQLYFRYTLQNALADQLQCDFLQRTQSLIMSEV